MTSYLCPECEDDFIVLDKSKQYHFCPACDTRWNDHEYQLMIQQKIKEYNHDATTPIPVEKKKLKQFGVKKR